MGCAAGTQLQCPNSRDLLSNTELCWESCMIQKLLCLTAVTGGWFTYCSPRLYTSHGIKEEWWGEEGNPGALECLVLGGEAAVPFGWRPEVRLTGECSSECLLQTGDEEVDEAVLKQLEEAFCLQVLVILGEFTLLMPSEEAMSQGPKHSKKF